MKLSLLLKTYREAHEISQRELARRCGLSNSLISLMEMGVNPQTGRRFTLGRRQVPELSNAQSVDFTVFCVFVITGHQNKKFL